MTQVDAAGERLVGFFDHLRFIHFTVVLVAATIIIATVDVDDEMVRTDLTAVENIMNTVAPLSEKSRGLDYGVLETLVRGELGLNEHQRDSGTIPAAPKGTLTFEYAGRPHTVTVTLMAPVALVFHGLDERGWSAEAADQQWYSDLYRGGMATQHQIAASGGSAASIEDTPLFGGSGVWERFKIVPASVTMFAEFWDELSRMRHGYRLRSSHFVHAFAVTNEAPPNAMNIRNISSPLRDFVNEQQRGLKLVPLTAKWAPNDLLTTDEAAVTLPISENDSWATVGYSEFSRKLVLALRVGSDRVNSVELAELVAGDILIVGDAEYDHVSLDLEKRLLARAPSVARRSGPFALSFPSLAAYVASLGYRGNIEAPLLDALVARDAAQHGTPIEIAGLKITRAAIGFWGLAVLLAFQLYFYSHLRELVRRAPTREQAEASAWLVVYPGSLNTLIALASASGIPFAAVFFALRALRTPDSASLCVALSMLTASFLVLVAIIQIRCATNRQVSR